MTKELPLVSSFSYDNWPEFLLSQQEGCYDATKYPLNPTFSSTEITCWY